MKNKILPYIISIWIGVIITTIVFLVYEITNTNNSTSSNI